MQTNWSVPFSLDILDQFQILLQSIDSKKDFTIHVNIRLVNGTHYVVMTNTEIPIYRIDNKTEETYVVYQKVYIFLF